jgi:2,4-dienoyl-CoA reductase (NADPH2)
MQAHAEVTAAVHEAGSKICMQILHAGRYAYHPWCVAPSPLKSPISPHPPKEMTAADVEATIDDYVRAAELAKEAGYDGVEVSHFVTVTLNDDYTFMLFIKRCQYCSSSHHSQL